jgi:elongation factor 1-alpha
MASAGEEVQKPHVSVVVGGHVDAGKSTTCGHLLFQLGEINQRELDKMKEEAAKLNKQSFEYAFFLDVRKAERERGITIECTTKEFKTPNFHYTIIDAPGHKDFIKNFITGSGQADSAILMVPADLSGFITSIKKGDRKSGEVEGQTRKHAMLFNTLGIKQLIVCINKMDDKSVNYSEERFNEIANEVKHMLQRTGWSKDFVENSVPILPISGLAGDNLFKPSGAMPWFKGCSVTNRDKKKVTVATLHDALDQYVCEPKRDTSGALRMPVSSVLKIPGIGDVICGRVERGTVKAGDIVSFLPTHTASNLCTGKVFSVEMHRKNIDAGRAGDNIGICIKGLGDLKPTTGDTMVLLKDPLKQCKTVTVTAQVYDHPGEIKVGYSPTGFVKTSRSSLQLKEIKWKISKDTGKDKVVNPLFFKSGDTVELVFEPKQPIIIEKFADSPGFGRIAIMEGAQLVMIGMVTDITFADN